MIRVDLASSTTMVTTFSSFLDVQQHYSCVGWCHHTGLCPLTPLPIPESAAAHGDSIFSGSHGGPVFSDKTQLNFLPPTPPATALQLQMFRFLLLGGYKPNPPFPCPSLDHHQVCPNLPRFIWMSCSSTNFPQAFFSSGISKSTWWSSPFGNYRVQTVVI